MNADVDEPVGVPCDGSEPNKIPAMSATVDTDVTQSPAVPQASYVYLRTVDDQPTTGTASATQPVVYIRGSGSSQQKFLSTITPVLVLANSATKGTMEANVMLESSPPAFLRLSGQLQNIQAMARANLIARTQEHIAQQLGGEARVKLEDGEGCLQIKVSNREDNQMGEVDAKTKTAGGKVYLCEMEGCGKTFASAGFKKFHQTALGHFMKAMQCPYDGCHRKFDRPAHFKYHQLTHTDNRQYECNVGGCTKRFFTAQRLKVHMRTHTGEKPFVCSDCGKSFTTAGNLKNHERIHSGERPFACDFEGCTRKFTECSSLKKHKLVHTGEKPFECNICLKTFSQSGSRKVHMKRHEIAVGAAVNLRLEQTSMAVATSVTVKQEGDQDLLKDSQDIQKMVVIHEVTPHFQADVCQTSQNQTDHVVTVVTQPADKMDLQGNILETDESLQTQDKPVSVVILSQPQEIVSLTTTYSQAHIPEREEIIYETDLLHTDLDHEEIAHSEFSLQSLTQGSQGSSDMGVGDGIMAPDEGLTEHGNISSSSQAGKEMAMDPMMESDDDTDHTEDVREKV